MAINLSYLKRQHIYGNMVMEFMMISDAVIGKQMKTVATTKDLIMKLLLLGMALSLAKTTG